MIVDSSSVLSFRAVDGGSNWSQLYIETYTIDNTSPQISTNPSPGLYKTPVSVTLTTTDPDSTFTTYYTTDGTDPQSSSTRQIYTGLINILKTTTLRFSAVDPSGNWGPNYTNIYTIDMTPPSITININGGSYNTTKIITLTTNDRDSTTTTYYTTDGTDPQTSGSRNIYTNPLTISNTTTLRYSAIDIAGNWSPNYTQTYTIDTTPPTAKANPIGGLYNSSKSVTLSINEPGNIYYTINGNIPSNVSTKYTNPINILSTTNLKYIAVDLAGNKSPIYTQTYTIDKIPPTAKANLPSGLYNINKVVKLSMNKNGTIYYTLNGKTPTITSSKYTKPISISSTSTMKFLAVDLAGNKSPIYTNMYTIDKINPKISITSPKNGATGFSKTANIGIRFSEYIKSSTKWSKIIIKDKFGQLDYINAWTSGTTIFIKTNPRSANSWYIVSIPASAVKDTAGNNLLKSYTFKFETGP